MPFRRRPALLWALVLMLGLPQAGIANVSFSKKTIATSKTAGAGLLHNPTAIAVGPDGRVYVANQTGRIHIIKLGDDLSPQSVERIETIYFTPNFNSDGTPADAQYGRLVLGLSFDPASTADKPVLYVTHSDPRIGYNNSAQAQVIDIHSGMLTKLTGPEFDKGANRTDLITGLPRSRENHGPTGMHWGPDGWLYFTVGSHTNNGAPSAFFSYLDEVYLTAAVLRANVKSGVFYPMDVRNVKAPHDEVPGLFEVFATGYRNAYDLVWHSNGNLYAVDNGANGGLGGTPGPEHGCPNGKAFAQPNQPDHMHLIHFGAYGGHPNPARGECIFDDGAAYSPKLSPASNYTAPIYGLDWGGTSTNGIAEYQSNAFQGAMAGDLIAATYAGDENIRRIVLTPDGYSVKSLTKLGSFSGPLDLAISPQGVIFVAEHGASAVSALVPGQAGSCNLAGDAKTTDSDGDGYTNQDEIDNGTDPCNPSSYPPDFDGDGISDLNDLDDDGDGIPDAEDQFYLDALNGRGTPDEIAFEWNPGDPPYGNVGNTGFTGVQITKHGKRFVAENLHVGAAGGFLSLTTTPGTNRERANSQDNALQIGVDATAPKRIHVRLTQPFFGVTPNGKQAAGLFVGLDEDNYVQLVVTADNGTGRPGIEFGVEIDGVYQNRFGFKQPSINLPGPNDIDLVIRINASRNSVSAFYSIDGAGEANELVGTLGVGEAPGIEKFFTVGLAAGILTTHAGSNDTMTFGFDFFRVQPAVGLQEPSTNQDERGEEFPAANEAAAPDGDDSKWWEFGCATSGSPQSQSPGVHWPWIGLLALGAIRFRLRRFKMRKALRKGGRGIGNSLR